MDTVANATSAHERRRREAEEAQTGGRSSPEAGRALMMLGEAQRCLEMAGELGEGCRPEESRTGDRRVVVAF